MKEGFTKRGELTTGFFVGLAISVVGLVLLLLIFYNIAWQTQIDERVCKESVIFRGTASYVPGGENYVPLKCKTQKICVGDECDEFSGVKDVDRAKLDSVTEIEKLLAGEIVSCWNMMGEGKLSLFSSGLFTEITGLGNVYPSCVVCSRIAFDEEYLAKEEIKLGDVNVRNYMLSYKVPGKNVSYYGYLLGENGKFVTKESITLDNVKLTDEKPVGDIPMSQELAVVFMQVSAPKTEGVFANTGVVFGATWGTAFVSSPIRVVQLSARFVGAGTILALVGGAVQYGSTIHNQGIAASYCGDAAVGDKIREGCSVVRLIDYNKEDITNYCSVIESIS